MQSESDGRVTVATGAKRMPLANRDKAARKYLVENEMNAEFDAKSRGLI